MASEQAPYPPVVWVAVEKVQRRETLWTYRLYEEKPDSPRSGRMLNRSFLPYKFCHSYLELCAWLRLCRLTPPPPDYFAPTRQELDEGVDSILRPVTRPR